MDVAADQRPVRRVLELSRREGMETAAPEMVASSTHELILPENTEQVSCEWQALFSVPRCRGPGGPGPVGVMLTCSSRHAHVWDE